MRGSRRVLAALALVAVGRLLSPTAVPVYDGIGQPDEPYRYVSAPAGTAKTAAPTEAHATAPLKDGLSSSPLTVQTAEIGSQFSLFVPQKGLAAAGTSAQVSATPLAATAPPLGAVVDGNVYDVQFAGSGPVTLRPTNAQATLFLRATSARQPGPTMYHRVNHTAPWAPLKTVRGGLDIYVANFPGAGDYVLAFPTNTHHGKGTSPLPYAVVGGLVLLAVIVVVVRLRSAG